jgi:hypothetical protein
LKTIGMLIFVAISGIAITLPTGLLPNTPEMLVGAQWNGYPLAWLVQQLGNPAYPTVYNLRPLRLIADIAFWAVIAAIALFVYTKIRKPMRHHFRSISQVPAKSWESDAMSEDLCRRGFKFVGSTICYAFMQAVGMVNDHTVNCVIVDLSERSRKPGPRMFECEFTM